MVEVRFSGAQLRAIRKARELSCTQLAAAIGRSSWTIENWERGAFAPKAESLPALVDVLDCALADLFAPVKVNDPAGGAGSSGLSKVVRTISSERHVES